MSKVMRQSIEEVFMADTYITVDDQNFEQQVLRSSTPVVVDFWAPWCGPCRAMAPTFEELSKEYHGKLIFAKMNTDENERTPGQLGIQGIPTLIFFRDGREVNRIVGLVQKPMLKRQIDGVLGAVA
jgi:thioredoxin 1